MLPNYRAYFLDEEDRLTPNVGDAKNMKAVEIFNKYIKVCKEFDEYFESVRTFEGYEFYERK